MTQSITIRFIKANMIAESLFGLAVFICRYIIGEFLNDVQYLEYLMEDSEIEFHIEFAVPGMLN
ncbi:Protein of unknown function [Pyronema omphalodes CBS 100304]|uniref:Uncharacterized protein n=1 Tax=Pyronema omphalodes (strain CBS 100304) TaxID=1076935 RepID=U4KXF9_PYROM|nr:Protein of unknown function [Pyronema omphalodes CBS 100304]